MRLWREIYGEPPPLADDPDLLSRVLVESLPPLPPYEIGKPETRSRPSRAQLCEGAAEQPRERGELTASTADPWD